jgi:hypothetical protein
MAIRVNLEYKSNKVKDLKVEEYSDENNIFGKKTEDGRLTNEV